MIAPVVTAVAGDRRVDLSWQAIAEAVKFRIRLGPAGGRLVQIAVTSNTVTSHTITGLVNGDDYDAMVVAVDAAKKVARSELVTFTPTVSDPVRPIRGPGASVQGGGEDVTHVIDTGPA